MELVSFFVSFTIVTLWGYIGYRLAEKKGYKPKLWCILAVVFGLIAIVILSLLKRKNIPSQQPTVTISEPKLLEDIVLHNWYFLNSKNESLGPISFTELKEKFQNGEIKLDSFVWNETYEDWKKIQDDHKTIENLEKKANL